MNKVRAAFCLGMLSIFLAVTGWGQEPPEVVPPEVRLRSYNQAYSYGGGYSGSGNWYGWAWSWNSGWNGWHNINWHSTNGGFESYGGSYSGTSTYTDWGTGTYSYLYDVTTTWPAPPALGTTVYTNSWAWSWPDGQGGTYGDTNGAVDTYPDIPQPGGYPWRFAQYYKFEPYAYGDQDPENQWWWTNYWSWSVSDSTRAYIDLHTGGPTNSTAQTLFALTVSAYNAETWEAIDPTDIVIRGVAADSNGVVALTLNDNGIYDVTPTLPAAFSNYYFQIDNPAALRPRIVMDFDDQIIEMQGNVWIHFPTNDSGPTDPSLFSPNEHAPRALPPGGTPQITWTNGPNNVTGKTVSRVVGEKVVFRIEGMDAYPDAKYEWTVPSSAVAGWSQAAVQITGYTNWAGYDTNVIKTNSSVTFYCLHALTNARVSCLITIGTTNYGPLRTWINVNAPTVSFEATREAVVEVSTNYSGGAGALLNRPTLHFGRGSDADMHGVRFKYRLLSKPAVPAAFGMMVLQIGDSEVIENFTDQTSMISKSKGFDVFGPGIWFKIIGSGVLKEEFGDAPGEGLDTSSFRNSLQRWDKFTTYLMFQPGGLGTVDTVPVPLRMINWKWVGAATNSDPSNAATWTKMGGTPTPIVLPSTTVPFTQLPSWLGKLWSSDVTTYVTNSTPKSLPDLGGY